VLISSCASNPRFVTRGEPASAPKAANSSGATAAPTSSEKPLLTLEGTASYYASDFHGRTTSNGETFDMNELTAAHRTFPFGTRIRVTNLENNLQVIVRVNDRGPFVEGRLIDLSLAAAKRIDLIKTGTTKVRLEVLEWGKGE